MTCATTSTLASPVAKGCKILRDCSLRRIPCLQIESAQRKHGCQGESESGLRRAAKCERRAGGGDQEAGQPDVRRTPQVIGCDDSGGKCEGSEEDRFLSAAIRF